MSYISNWLKVKLGTADPHGPLFEVVRGQSGEWHYRQRRGGRIANDSENYASKSNAKRAAYAQAAMIPGATVRVIED